MGKSLLALPLFRESIERSARVLAPKNIDLIQIITSDDPTVFDNILHAFVGIAAIQVTKKFFSDKIRFSCPSRSTSVRESMSPADFLTAHSTASCQ